MNAASASFYLSLGFALFAAAWSVRTQDRGARASASALLGLCVAVQLVLLMAIPVALVVVLAALTHAATLRSAAKQGDPRRFPRAQEAIDGRKSPTVPEVEDQSGAASAADAKGSGGKSDLRAAIDHDRHATRRRMGVVLTFGVTGVVLSFVFLGTMARQYLSLGAVLDDGDGTVERFGTAIGFSDAVLGPAHVAVLVLLATMAMAIIGNAIIERGRRETGEA